MGKKGEGWEGMGEASFLSLMPGTYQDTSASRTHSTKMLPSPMLPVCGLVTETEDGFMSAGGAQSTSLFCDMCKRNSSVRCRLRLTISNEMAELDGGESAFTALGYLQWSHGGLYEYDA